jgi:hypothetical protein
VATGAKHTENRESLAAPWISLSFFPLFPFFPASPSADSLPGLSKYEDCIAVSTFYVLPPRPFLEECLAAYLRPLFPGRVWTGAVSAELVNTLSTVVRDPGVYVIHREELPDGETVAQALADGFGAEPGDEVIEIRPGNKLGEWAALRWHLDYAA